jgi:hypothetical protein
MNSSGRHRLECRLARAGYRLIDVAFAYAAALAVGDVEAAKKLAIQLSRRAVRNAEALTKLEDLPPRLRRFHQRQRARKRT